MSLLYYRGAHKLARAPSPYKKKKEIQNLQKNKSFNYALIPTSWEKLYKSFCIQYAIINIKRIIIIRCWGKLYESFVSIPF